MDNIIKFFTEGGLAKIAEAVGYLMAAVTIFIGFSNKPSVQTTWGKVVAWVGKLLGWVTHKDQADTFSLPIIGNTDGSYSLTKASRPTE